VKEDNGECDKKARSRLRQRVREVARDRPVGVITGMKTQNNADY
jgi:hypothetical protein